MTIKNDMQSETYRNPESQDYSRTGSLQSIKWGIIGCGDVTEVKSGPAFNLVPNSSLVAVMRRDATKAQDYAKRHGVPKWYDNADDLINDNEVNAIYIATPPNAHAELTIRALKAKKPVYVEKPMALNYAQALEMVQASEKYQTPLYVAYYRRALPTFVKVKQLLNDGIIGAVKMVNIQLHKSFSQHDIWRVQPDVSGGGHFVDLASHQLDLLDFFFGPILKVNAFTLNQGNQYIAEDFVSAHFLLPNAVVANGSWCFTVPEFLQTDVFEIIGDKGKIKFSCFNFIPIEVSTFEGTQSFDFPAPQHVEQNLIQNVVDDLLGNGISPSNGVSGSRTNWVMDEVLKDFYSQL